VTALRPVYIDRGAAAVRLDGPALIVEEPGRSEGRFPLRLLSRIVVRGPVPWSMEALFACLAAGIPVTFLSLDGDIVGLCLGRDHPEESLAVLLDRLTGEPLWAETWERWCRAAERRAIVEVARRRGLLPGGRNAGDDLRAECVRAQVLARLPGGDAPGARSALRRLDGCLVAHLNELLGRAGVPLAYRGGRGSALDLRPAFRAALRWYLWTPLEHWRQLQERHPPADQTAARRRLVAQYETAAPQVAARFCRLVASLDRFLREELP
jgi:CRISPR associated protein Cas1